MRQLKHIVLAKSLDVIKSNVAALQTMAVSFQLLRWQRTMVMIMMARVTTESMTE